jgi:tetratricopeptide (TPR) repeat protein
MRVGWRAAVVVAALGCTRSATERPPGPIVSALVALDAEMGNDAETAAAAFTGLQDIARRVEQRHRRSRGDIAADITAVVFGELGFAREIDSTATRFFQLSSVIRDRRGSCLGLGALYLAIGERIAVPLDGVLLPGHFFVRTRGPDRHNVELLRRGEAMPDDWYRAKYGPWPGLGSAYFRPVSPTELAGIHWYNRGNDLRKGGDLGAAEAAFARAARDFPEFAEAHASLGAIQQLHGDFVGAAASYREAARLWPDLPGLDGNLELLRRQTAPALP